MVPIAVWLFYNVIFVFGSRWISDFVPGLAHLNLSKFRRSFKAAVEEFFSPRLLPVLSISFLLVPLSLAVTGRTLGGPPLCFQPCGVCLSHWATGVQVPYPVLSQYLTKDAFEDIGISMRHYNSSGYNMYHGSGHQIVVGDFLPEDEELGHELILRLKSEFPGYGCGYVNGQELLAYYTMVQTSFLLFLCVTVAMTICMAWQVAEVELKERKDAEDWLKEDNPTAFALRRDIIKKFGDPVSSSVRPEASLSWVTSGFVAALTFILLGCGKWSIIPRSHSSTLLIVLNVLSIVLSALILHLGFFGRLLALYTRNLHRVEFLSYLLEKNSENDNYITPAVSVPGSGINTPQRQSSGGGERDSLNESLQDVSDQLADSMEVGAEPGRPKVNINNIDAWWACRNFVLNNDFSIEYDMGGLAMAMTFQLDIVVFSVMCFSTYHEGFDALLGAPGSYCAYACMYITTCLVKIFSLATQTFEEQDRHCKILSAISNRLLSQSESNIGGSSFYGATSGHDAQVAAAHRATASDYINDYNEQQLNISSITTGGSQDAADGNVDEFGIMMIDGVGDEFDDGNGVTMDEETPMLSIPQAEAVSKPASGSSPRLGHPRPPSTGASAASSANVPAPLSTRDKFNNPYYFNMNSPSLDQNEHVGLSISPPSSPPPGLAEGGPGVSTAGISAAGIAGGDNAGPENGEEAIPVRISVPQSQLKHNLSFCARENTGVGPPKLMRATSTQLSTIESKRQTLMEIINQIK